MRMIAVKFQPVARILAIIYAVFGLISWLQATVTSASALRLPFGFTAPMFQLNLNFDLARSSSTAWNAILCGIAVVCFAISGWITGAVLALLFNAIAKWTGGFDAKYFDSTSGIKVGS